MRRRFNVLRISLRAMLVLVALCAIGFRWHREIRAFGRDVLFYPWYRLDDEGSWPIDYLESELTFNLVAFSPDGKTLATVGRKEKIAVEIKQYRSSGDDTVGRKSRVTQTIALCDVPARRPAWEADLGDRIIKHLLFSADGKTVVTIDVGEPTSIFDGPPPGPAKAIRWNVADGRRLSTTFVNKTPIWSAALSPDGNTLAVGSGGFNRNPPGRLTLWNLRSGAKIAELEIGSLEVAALAYAPDGRSLAIGLDVRAEKPGKSVRHELTILDAATLRPRASLFKGEDEVKFLAFSADGATLASAHDGGIIRLWDAKTWQVRTTIDDPVVVLSGVKVSADGRDADINSLALSPDGNTLAAGLGRVVGIWDGKTGQRRSYIKDGWVTSLSFGAGGRTLAIAEAENESPLIIDLETGYELDWSNRGFPSRKAAYWVAGVFLLVSALALSRMKRRRRAHDAAKDAKTASAGGKRHRILIVGVGFGVSFLLVAGVFIYRTICARRLAAAIDAFELPADQRNDVWKKSPVNQTEKIVFKNFVDQAVFSPRCSRLVEHLGVQSHRDKKTKMFVMEDLPSALVFRSRYRDGRGRGREVFLFKKRQSFPVPTRWGFRAIAITDERGRVLTWKELGENSNFDSADLERAGDRLVLAIYSDDQGYYSTYRFDLAGDEIRPIRVEPFPNPKIMDALIRIHRSRRRCATQSEVRQHCLFLRIGAHRRRPRRACRRLGRDRRSQDARHHHDANHRRGTWSLKKHDEIKMSVSQLRRRQRCRSCASLRFAESRNPSARRVANHRRETHSLEEAVKLERTRSPQDRRRRRRIGASLRLGQS